MARIVYCFVLASLLARTLLDHVPTAGGEETLSREHQVKAAFLVNFASFFEVDAAPVPEDAFTMCVYPETPVGSALEKLLFLKYPKRVLRISRPAQEEQLRQCSMVYLSTAAHGRIEEILAALRSRPILTVSDIPGFVDKSGMIELLLEDGKVRFRINRDSAQASHIRISSNLLKLATQVLSTASMENRPDGR